MNTLSPLNVAESGINCLVHRKGSAILPVDIFIQGQYNGGYYGLTVDEETSEVYVADAINYVQRGIVYRYSWKGLAVDFFNVGIISRAVAFEERK